METILAFLSAKKVWILVSAAFVFYKKIKTKVQPLIIEAEKRMLDGRLDEADRKAWVQEAIKVFEVKLNFIEKLVLNFMIDIVAKNLPDIVIEKNAGGIYIPHLEKKI